MTTKARAARGVRPKQPIPPSVADRPAIHHCPSCEQSKAVILDSRPIAVDGVMRRRRYACSACGFRFSTHEIVIGVAGAGAEDMRRRASDFRRDMTVALREHFGDLTGA